MTRGPAHEVAPQELAEIARGLRVLLLRTIHHARSGHTGSAMSCIDILTCLYFREMHHTPYNAEWPQRDRMVLSKGHASAALYVALHQAGYVTRAELRQMRQLESILQGNPDSRRCPGVEASTGSLGQGLSIGHGMALALRGGVDGGEEPRVYVVLGDGELQEGQIWEAAMSAGHRGTANLCAIIDANGLQLDGAVRDIKNVEPLAAKLEAFGWRALDVSGHDFAALCGALDAARGERERPTAIIARTVMGKGVSFMENAIGWHSRAPDAHQLAEALAELDKAKQPAGERAGTR
ncbi:MAG: transketolase [Myxococcales bacterium]|nr:transketolase [Myxococcales bacterium]